MMDYKEDSFFKWLAHVSTTRRVETIHIGDFFTYVSGNRYRTGKGTSTQMYMRWYDAHVKVHAKEFLPYHSWLNDFVRANKFKLVFSTGSYICGFQFVLFTEDEYNDHKKTG